ncbi:hypothetical protein AKJ62_01300 [candidate division MSBL1 archaeon SCGC-AAA259D14]|uniref:Uncharacterized protein n=1 Tax=candidate division MSBL1 archaeon SCGC-AAA259D14 TaxID=1698261 RepID=A0A133U7V4_9EURY|nr:hypothetical protein AKJ62_01300 [candidate division MSBL1 archaeon SCGC-AAA259D14]
MLPRKHYASESHYALRYIAKWTVWEGVTYKQKGSPPVKHSNTRRSLPLIHRKIHVMRNVLNYIQGFDKHFGNKTLTFPFSHYATSFSIRYVRNFVGDFCG